MQSPMLKRQTAAQATLDRFQGKPLKYGKDDCVRMAAFCLRKLGVKTPLIKAGSYTSEIGAARALRKMGYEDVKAAVDAVGLPRIAPAMALAGDILALPSERFGGALFIALGNGRVLGYFDGQFQVGEPLIFDAAWRSI